MSCPGGGRFVEVWSDHQRSEDERERKYCSAVDSRCGEVRDHSGWREEERGRGNQGL